jgi:hypothetical protein
MITPSFSLTATERVLPRLALDFTTANLDPRVTFTRTGNTATVTNSSGYVVGINADLPRFDFNPVTLVCRGLLIEEARTNLMTYSNAFDDNTLWGWVNLSVSSVANTNIDGTANSLKLVEDTTATVTHTIQKTVTFTSGQAFTSSVYVKKAGRRYVRMRGANQTTYPALVTFDLDTGSVQSTGAGSGTITNAGNGWYRITITGTAGASVGTSLQIQLLDDSLNITYTGDGTSGVYIYGAQVEAGAFATSYIPTTTTALTRNADLAQMTGANFSDWYNATQGTFLTDVEAKAASFAAYFGGTSGNEMYTRVAASGPTFVVVTGGSTQANFGASALTSKIANSYKENRFLTCTNAGTVTGDVLGTIPVVSSLTLGSAPTSSRINGTIKRFSYYSIQLTIPEVQAISK